MPSVELYMGALQKLAAISVCFYSSLCLSSSLGLTHFPQDSVSQFIFFFVPLWVATFFLSYSLYVSLFSGATVLLVNATDLDASREFGQASLIYSLEGSSQFRLNSRSGMCVCASVLIQMCVFSRRNFITEALFQIWFDLFSIHI